MFYRKVILSSIVSVAYSTSKVSSIGMQVIRGDGHGGRGMTLLPHSGKYDNTVVFLHGLGDTADGWASMMPSLGIKDTKFILPTADSRPIALNGGHSMPGWSNVYGLDANSPEDKEGFDLTSKRIDRIIQAEIDKGISPNRIVVGGFSQGGAASLHYCLRSPHALGACLGLSCWLPMSKEYPGALSSTASTMKVLLFHGTDDPVVSFKWGEKSYTLLNSMLPSNVKFVPIEVS